MKLKSLLHKMGLDAVVRAALDIGSCMPSLFWVRMDLEQDGPAAEERLFSVSQDTDWLELDFIVSLSGASGTLEAVDQDTGEALWQRTIDESVVFTQAVGPLKKGREYAVRFTSAAPCAATATVSSRSSLIQDLSLPAGLNGLARPA